MTIGDICNAIWCKSVNRKAPTPIKATDIIDKDFLKTTKDLEKSLKNCVDLMNKLNSTVKESDNINIA